MAFDLFLALQNFISSGITGSSPYYSLKGVKFIARDTDELWLHTALGNSSAHLPLG
jgi:hypothetical protein